MSPYVIGRHLLFFDVTGHPRDVCETDCKLDGKETVMRLDKYLKVTRLIKRRTVANEACDNETKAEVLAVRENVRKEEVQDLFRFC